MVLFLLKTSLLCSVVDSVYDILGYVHPFMGAPHDGMLFSAPYHNHDLFTLYDCASELGGGWWYTQCSLWVPTTTSPSWFSYGDSTFYSMKKVRLMVKLQ